MKIGGKFDAGYQFKHTANKDSATGGSNGGTTTETLGDGGASTSRITVQAKEDLGHGWATMVDLDLRFGTIEEGKNATTDGSGGINSNDKKALYLTSPFGNLRWGVMNVVSQQYWDYEEKPYMVNIKDLEIVKYGVYSKRFTSLTNRNTEYDTPILTIGPVSNRLKGNYAIGSNKKSGSSDVDGANSGNAWMIAETGAVGKWVNWTISTAHRTSKGSTKTGMIYGEDELSIHPFDGLKIGASYGQFRGYGDATAVDGST
ncbi:MAG TPA: porin, partial [Rhodocyclaceae bacterium]|nr:porin [Rhodocyclaceae bacterium]